MSLKCARLNAIPLKSTCEKSSRGIFLFSVLLANAVLQLLPQSLHAQSTAEVSRPSALVVLIGGMDSDPTAAQMNRTARRHEGNSGMYRLMSDLKHPAVSAKYFNWNGTEAGEIKSPQPPGPHAICNCIRLHVQQAPTSRVIVVGNSWGGHTAWEVCHQLVESSEPVAIDYVVFLDPSSAGRAGNGRPAKLPVNVNQASNFHTRNLFGWKSWPKESRLENIDLGDQKHGFLTPGGPAYDSAFDFSAHVAAEWDERIHTEMRRRILTFVERP